MFGGQAGITATTVEREPRIACKGPSASIVCQAELLVVMCVGKRVTSRHLCREGELSMKPWREGLLTTVILALGVVLILVGILLWALLFFKAT